MIRVLCLLLVLVAHGAVAAPPAAVTWKTVGRAVVQGKPDSFVISGGLAITEQSWKDYEFTFQGVMAPGSEQTQIWSAVRVRDRGSLYAIGYRGGIEPELSLARYATDGQSRFLGWVPLDPAPDPKVPVTFRIMVSGKRFQIYLNNEDLPRINIEDNDALWEEGGVGLGGGWLPAVFRSPKVVPLDAARLAAFNKVGDRIWAPPAIDKQAVRAKQRAAYQPVKVPALADARQEFSLDGQWLFIPDQDLPAGESAEKVAAANSDDKSWHVVSVPSFWTPTLGWLHGEFGMPGGLKDAPGSKGPSDKLVAGEFARVDAQTFDWRKTKSGWYRQYFDLPADLKGRDFELIFDAVAKVSEVWVNGQRAAVNVGMFREIRTDITKLLKPGRNVIAVHVIGSPERNIENAKKVADVAVTVEVTLEMLNSLPHGMTDNNCGGIWQPVRLLVTDPVRVGGVHIQTTLDSMQASIDVENRGMQAGPVSLAWKIVNTKDSSVLASSTQAVSVKPQGKTAVKIQTSKLRPKLWSPTDPNLYTLELSLSQGGKVVDEKSERFGFRTFTVAGNKFLLNGQPFWLRGGNHFPVTLRPNDAALAKKFTQLAKDGNLNITRSHGVPFTEPWFRAADEIGMGVSYEGTWPWLMLNGPTPDPELVKVWREEFASLIERFRNHPSLFFWTINNEMQFYKREALGPEVLKEKWTILDAMIRKIRELDPTRPIVPDSAYTRKETEKKFPGFREQGGFDDGDIDDVHSYFGWYNESPFNLFDGKFGSSATPDRPLISQEMSTGYPRNDDWPSRGYQFARYVPQSLVGNYAFEGNDPAIFMARQAFMTKELAEVIRRTSRDQANGVMHFAYLTWFTDVWKSDTIKPKLTYYALQTALQPVLVSAELFGRHLYAGSEWKHRVCIANDSNDARALPAGSVSWTITAAGQKLAAGQANTPAVPYYSNAWVDLTIPIPATLPSPRVNAVISYQLTAGGKVVSTNQYDIVLATRDWADAGAAKFSGILYDPQGKSAATTAGIPFRKVSTLGGLNPAVPLVIGDIESALRQSQGAEKLRKFVADGGRMLLLQPGASLVSLYPEQIKAYRKAEGEIVVMEVPESPIFNGIEPLDTAWFERENRKVPIASSGTYQLDRSLPGVLALADECKLHSDIPKEGFFAMAGAPIVQLKIGKGTVLASEMMLSAKARDPIAGRLLSNMLGFLSAK